MKKNKKIAPTDKGGAQTAAGHGIQLLKSNDTPGIYGALESKKYGSCVTKQ